MGGLKKKGSREKFLQPRHFDDPPISTHSEVISMYEDKNKNTKSCCFVLYVVCCYGDRGEFKNANLIIPYTVKRSLLG